MNIDAEIKRLEEDLAALKAKATAAKTKQWEPKGHGWYVNGCGGVSYTVSTESARMYGSECQTREQAEELSKARKTFQWMCQLAFELNPSGKLGGDYYVCFDKTDECFVTGSLGETTSIELIFETQEAAEKAAEIMNASPEDWKFYK